jgi:hypothetical protein
MTKKPVRSKKPARALNLGKQTLRSISKNDLDDGKVAGGRMCASCGNSCLESNGLR